MRRQVCQFYDTNMENNTVEDWLKLLLYTTCQDKELLSKVLAIAWTLKTAQDVIDYVEAEECGRVNAERLLGGKAIAAIVRGQQGDAGNSGVRCFACQKQGHTKQECTVEKSKLYCQHCKQRGIHNTNRFCRAFKANSDNKDKTKKGKNKPVDKKTKVNKARTVSNTEKEEEEPEEDDEDEDSDSPPSLSAGSNGGRWVRLTLRGSSKLPMKLTSSSSTRSSKQKTTHPRMSLGTIRHQILQKRRRSLY